MNLLRNIGGKLDDWMNPIVVKELRQAVQSKFVLAVLILFLAGQMVIMGGFAIGFMEQQAGSMEQAFRVGQDAFTVFLGVLITTCMVFIPAYAGIRLMAERNDANVDLLFISTLRPRSILWGKLVAAVILTALIYSVCAPFMTFTYLLRGIDLFSMMFMLGVIFLVVVGTSVIALFIAAIPANRIFRAFFGLAWIGLLIPAVSGLITMSYELVRSGLFFELNRWDFWLAQAGMFAVMFCVLALLFCFSIAMLSPPSSNRALPVRIWLLAGWLISAVVFGAMAIYDGFEEWIAIWLIGNVMILSLALLAGVSEREQLGPRLRRMIPRSRALRLPAFFFYSGSAGGVAFAVVLLALSITGVAVFVEIHRQWFGRISPGFGSSRNQFMTDVMQFTGLLAMYTFCYALTGLHVRRRLASEKLKPHFTWLVSFLLAGLASCLPILFALAFYYNDDRAYYQRDYTLWMLGSPFMALIEVFDNNSKVVYYLVFVSIWSAVMFAVSLPWFIRGVTDFHPSPPGIGARKHANLDIKTVPEVIAVDDAHMVQAADSPVVARSPDRAT